MEDKELIALIIADPTKGMSALIDAYGGAVNSICSHMLRGCDSSYVEDAVQESFLHIWKIISKGKVFNKSLKSYLYQVARNCAYDMLKTYCKEAHISMDQMLYESVEEFISLDNKDLENQVAVKDQYNTIHKVMEEMDEPDRTIFILRYFYNYTVKEISQKTNLQQDNVESRLRRKKKHLKETLKKRGVTYGQE